MKTIVLAIVFALSIIVNAGAAYLAASPLLHWGVTPWTLAACGALAWPVAMIFRKTSAVVLSVLLTVLVGPRKAAP